MAQAAKHLRKNKDLEAQAEQERKEKEEERVKKRSRSRDKKRKVLGLFTGGVVRSGVMGVGWWGRGGWRGGQEGWGTPPPFFLCHAKLVRGAGAHMETQPRVCFYYVYTQVSLAHMYVLCIQTRGNGTTHRMLSYSSWLLYWPSCLIRLIRQRSNSTSHCVSVSLHISVSFPLFVSSLSLLSHCGMVSVSEISQQN